MLPSRIILTIFTFLLSQGNVAYALPQNPYEARSSYVSGRDIRDITDTLAEVVSDVSDSYDVRKRDIILESRLAGRELELSNAVVVGGAILSFISGGVGIAWAAKHKVTWLMNW